MTLNDPEPPKRGLVKLVNFFRFQAAIHRLRVNFAETIQYRPGQPAYEMFGIKRRVQRFKVHSPSVQEVLRTSASNLGTSIKTRGFCYCRPV